MFFGDMSVETFLQEYWQKKPLLIKNALPDFSDPLSPEELAGLACEEEAESRIVFTEGEAWRLKSGPFQETDFTSLPEENWTLLVQAVDHWFPDVKSLIQAVDFLPNWRIDDVMVSYAEKNAGVGPHFDYYDVFIIQGQGSRRWKIGQACDSQSNLVTDSGLKILEHFETQEEFIVESGDVLYIPPGIAHYGISEDSSLSYSIGFRAPSLSEMLISYSDEICAAANDDQRYTDSSSLSPTKATGEILPDAISTAKTLMMSALNNDDALSDWFGKHMTEPKSEDAITVPEQALQPKELLTQLAGGATLSKHPASRFAFIANEETLNLFVDGETFSFHSEAKRIKSLNKLLNTQPSYEELDLAYYLNEPHCLGLLTQLYNQGSLILQ